MAQYDSSFSGTHNDDYDSRITTLENKLTYLESLTDGTGLTGKWNITISGDQGHVVGTNDAAIATNALLQSGAGRADNSSGDTWIFYDTLSGSAESVWGIKHNQPSNLIEFYGGGALKTSINLSNGFVNTNGAYGFKRWSSLSLSASNYSDQDITITTHGRPVYLCLMGNNNPDNNAWCRGYIYRNGTELAFVTCHDPGASTNRPFCVQYLDQVGAGTYTYKFRVQTYSGIIGYTESGGNEAPSCVCFEI